MSKLIKSTRVRRTRDRTLQVEDPSGHVSEITAWMGLDLLSNEFTRTELRRAVLDAPIPFTVVGELE